MWKQRYKRTFWPNQAIILTICILLRFHWKIPFDGIVVFWLVMELGALLGAMWTTRLVGKFDRAKRNKVDLDLI
jgi:hypothetical protein